MKSQPNPGSSMMTRSVASWLWCAGAVVPVVASTSQAELINVPGDHPTIQAAIDAALDGDEVVVAPGTYVEAIDFLGKAIRLRSADGPEVTTIDGTGHYHVVECVSGEGPDTVLDGFTITGGHANGSPPDDRGGGMYNDGSSPTVTDCVFTGNAATTGAGMRNDGSSPTVTDCVFIANMADAAGGGMSNLGSGPILTNCRFSDNSAAFFGGGVHNNSSWTVIINCAFEGNTANRGGGMHNGGSSPTVTNCTFGGNVANDAGGGMWNAGSSPVITNSTFHGNSATVGGALTSMPSGGGVQSHPRLDNCVLWSNSPDEILEGAAGSEAIVLFSDVQGGWPGVGNIDSDPLFVDPDHGDCRLGAGSPCIDAADSTAVPADIADLDGDGDIEEPAPFDLASNPRFVDDPDIRDTGHGSAPNVDMGAFEFQVVLSPCPADVNGDEAIDILDLLAVLSAWGQSGVPADVNDDGIVGILDLLAVLSAWGPCPN